MAQQSISKISRASKSRVHEISIVDNFKMGYRNHEDITNLPSGVLVVGSQNVLVNTSSRVQMRQGYVLDGTKSTINAPIKSSFDWNLKGNGHRYLRAGFLTSAGNDGKLQFRYVDSSGNVTWTDLLTGLTSVSYNGATMWDSTELLRVALLVNGNSAIYEWNGAYDTVVSVTTNTITVTNNIGTSGFYNLRNRVITIRGVDYTYTGVSGKTFTGVTPDPTAQGANTPVAGDLAVQKVITTANGGSPGLPVAFKNDLISVLNNQIFVGSLVSPTIYMSRFGTYIDYSFDSPRLPTQGATATLDDNIVGFIPQEDVMYITAGKDYWYNTKLTQTTSLISATIAATTETFEVKPLKVNTQQAAQSQALVNKTGNNVIMVTNEPSFDQLGRVEDILGTPQAVNVSDPIKLDFDSYDFTGGSVFSWKRYLLVSIPTLGIIRIFNQTIKAWEAPQTIPVTSFYIVNGDLYGHSSLTSESYKLFTGYSDRATSLNITGQPISVSANFSYQNFGTRTTLKNANEFYIEGYINANTLLNCDINYEVDGFLATQTFSVDGSNKQIVAIPSDQSSLGKSSLGKEKLGGDITNSLTGLPPKFRVIKTFNRYNFYECQFSFSILGAGQRFELLAFGTNAAPADDTNILIKDGDSSLNPAPSSSPIAPQFLWIAQDFPWLDDSPWT